MLPIHARLFAVADGCWQWLGSIDKDGYGRYSGRMAHRAMWEERRGPIPSGHQLDHRCRNRACVNPEHLEPVTRAVNMARGATANKTACKSGHQFNPENTYRRPSGHRDCKECIRQRARRYKATARIA